MPCYADQPLGRQAFWSLLPEPEGWGRGKECGFSHAWCNMNMCEELGKNEDPCSTDWVLSWDRSWDYSFLPCGLLPRLHLTVRSRLTHCGHSCSPLALPPNPLILPVPNSCSVLSGTADAKALGLVCPRVPWERAVSGQLFPPCSCLLLQIRGCAFLRVT